MAQVSFYFDEMLNRAVSQQLIERGYPVTLATAVEMIDKDDFEHLAYATNHNMVFVTFDHTFAVTASLRSNYLAIVCLPVSLQADVGAIVNALATFAELYDSEKDAGKVHWF